MRWRCLFSLVVGLAIAGCTHAPRVTWNLEDPDLMREVVVWHVPPGTSIPAAGAFMKSEGFTVHLERNESFNERRSWVDIFKTHDHLDFLDCRRVQSAGSLLMSHFWEVALVLDGDVVRDVVVSHYVDGP